MAVPVEPHVLGLDRDAPLALEVHRVEVLGAHVAGVDGAGQLEDAVGERRLAVVDVGDDAESCGCERGPWSRSTLRDAACRSPAPAGQAGASLVASPASRRSKQDAHVANIKSQKKRNLQNEKRARAQQGRPLRAEDPRQDRGHAPRPAPRTPTTPLQAGAEAHRQGRRQGRHPQEPGRPPQVAPDEEAGRRAVLAAGLRAPAAPPRRDNLATSTSSSSWSGHSTRRGGRGPRPPAARTPSPPPAARVAAPDRVPCAPGTSSP